MAGLDSVTRQVRRVRRTRQRACAVAMAMLTWRGACATRPQTAYDVVHPGTAPVRNIGNFNEALRCMDELFIAQGKQDIYITTAGIPDATGLIAAGTKEMFITAVSRMSARSNAFHFVDYDPTRLDVQVLSEVVGLRNEFVAANHYVRGAITRLDSTVLRSSGAAGVSVPGLDAAINGSQVVSVVSIDLNVTKLVTRQIMPGISASSSIAVVQSGKGADIGGFIGKAGLSLSVSLDMSEGFHQAVRNLIELSTIEVPGKLTRMPYWQCLSIDSTNPNFRNEARRWFDLVPDGERGRFVSNALARGGSLQGGGDGSGAQLSNAIARYQADNDLVANGRIDFEPYYRLLASDSRHPATKAVVRTPAADTPPAAPPGLVVSSPRGPKLTCRVGDTMVVTVQPARDAYVYCYDQDASGTVAGIFPNRFQPDPFLRAGVQIEGPPAGQQSFALRFDQPGGSEAIACLGADREVGLRLPDRLKAQDLAPLPVHSLDEVAAQFRAVPSAQVADARLAVEVLR